jgi:hypothetical protein
MIAFDIIVDTAFKIVFDTIGVDASSGDKPLTHISN